MAKWITRLMGDKCHLHKEGLLACVLHNPDTGVPDFGKTLCIEWEHGREHLLQ